MHSRALGDGLVLRYFYDGCDNSVLRGFLPILLIPKSRFKRALITTMQAAGHGFYLIFLSGHDEL